MYPCHRCNGIGRLAHYAGVLGGICFKCHGSGKQKSRPKQNQAYSWNVYAEERLTGARIPIFRISAKTEEQALIKAKAQLARGTGYLPESAHVERVVKPK